MPSRILLIFFFLTHLYQSSVGQNKNTPTDTLPLLAREFYKPANWTNADKNRTFYYAQYSPTMKMEDAARIIKTEKDFETFLEAKSWCIDNFRAAIPMLLELITDTTKVGLTNTADLIIWDRLQTKDLQSYGHGGIINEDIFTIAGRCSHILNELTGEEMLLVHVATTLDELKIYQKLWKTWFRRL